MKLGFNEYQIQAAATAIYPKSAAIIYPALGLAEEAGEVAGKFAKHFRGDKPYDLDAVKKEMGDVLWMLAALATGLDIDLEDVAITNIEKLADRAVRGVVRGSGDNR
jgi:NTP pyrophosphatase (non-canonical NTP hydrolase)